MEAALNTISAPPVHFHVFRAMGCQMTAWLLHDSAFEARLRLEHVEHLMESWESRLSRFRPESELCALNNRSGEWVEVSPTLFDVLSVAIEAAERTNGLFDPTVLEALEQAGYDRSFELIGDSPGGLARTAAPRHRWREIELSPAIRAVRLPRGCRLDLGGIGKGWAAERAADILSVLGPCLVDAGGDLAIRGTLPGIDGWLVGLADPFEPDDDMVDVLVRDCGVATSGTDFRRWTVDGRTQHHIIDPRTGQPSITDVFSASVIAHDAVEADVLAKTVVLLGADEGRAYVQSRLHAHALIVTRDGSRLSTPGFPVANLPKGAAPWQ